MTRFSLAALLLLTLGFGRSFPCGAAPSIPIMNTAELRPGMHAVGRTVFHGTRVESFPVTILGVVRHFLGVEDLILFKIDSGYLKQKGLGIVAGMSGSPVYVNGRLIGAVAYGWSFAKDPVGGITPITAMLKDMPGQPIAAAAPASGPRPLPHPVVLNGHVYRSVALLPGRGSQTVFPTDTLTLRPTSSLMQVSGWSRSSMTRLQSLFGDSSLVPVSTLSMGGRPGPTTPIEPGSSIGVEMVSGDLEIAATGTLTYLDGHRFLAFGHPLAQLGDVRLPLTEAYVYNIYPSAQSPFKIATQLDEVGELSSDRSYAVGGTLGVHAPTVPVVINVYDETHKVRRTIHCRVFDHPLMTGALISVATADALHPVAAALGPTTARVLYRLQMPDRAEPLTFSDTASSTGIEEAVSSQVGVVLTRLAQNDFHATQPKQVSIDVTLFPGRHSAVIDRVFTDRSRYRPGETMQVGVELKPFNGPPVVHTFRVPIPIDAPKGAVKLALSGGSDMVAVRKRLTVAETTPHSLEDVYRVLATEDKSDQLVLTAVYSTSSALVGSERYSFLPESLRDLAATVNSSALMPDKDVYTERQTVPWVISGSQLLGVDVEIKEATGYKPAAVIPEVTAPTAAHATRSPSPTAEASKTVAVETPKGGPDAKVLPSSTRRWLLTDSSFLQRGELSAVQAGDDGTLSLGPQVEEIHGQAQAVGWTLAVEGDTVATGFGPPARVEVRRHGVAQSYDLPASAVTALMVDKSGTVWAASSYPGRVYRLGRDGAATSVLETRSDYVWALTADRDGDVYVGTGRPAALYRIAPQGTSQRVVELPDSHVRSVAVAPDGTVYLGTGNRGLLYRVRGGQAEALYQTAYGSIDSLVWDGPSTLVLGSGKGVYRMDVSSGKVESRDLPSGPILSMASRGGHVYTGTLDGRVYDGTALLTDERSGPVMALASAGESDVLFLSASPAITSRVSGRLAPLGLWTSPVLDATDTARWGSIRWQQETPGGSAVLVYTRSGNTPNPDGEWSPWALPTDEHEAHRIASPGARYLQIRVDMTGTLASPEVSGLTVYYRPQGREPHLAFTAPVSGDAWSGTHKITWKADQGPLEELVYTVDASADGKTWNSIAIDHRATLKDHGLTPDDKPVTSREESVEWNTHQVPDGVYRIRLRVKALSDTVEETFTSAPVTIVNTRPRIAVSRCQIADAVVHVEGTATASLVPVLEVAWRLDGGDWHLAEPTDGMFDAPQQGFRIEQPVTGKTPGSIELRVTDEAGNVNLLKKTL